MTDEQINKAIHERIMGDCWHKFEPYRAIHGNHACLRGCGFDRFDGPNPSYTTDLNAMAKVVVKVAEPDNYSHFSDTLLDVIRREHSGKDWQEYNNGYLDFLLITSTARQLAEACLRAMGYWEGE